MAAYGDVNRIREMLGEDALGFDAAFAARLAHLQAVVTAWFEEATGRRFGVAQTPRQLVLRALPPSDVLILPVPALTISAIAYGATDAGGAVSGGAPLDPADWTVALADRTGAILALRTTGGTWWGAYAPLLVTGTWADGDTDAEVPEDVAWAVEYVTAERMKREQASPADLIGPDGSPAPPRDPMRDPLVKAVVEKYRLRTRELVL